jgi:hypothetical protein
MEFLLFSNCSSAFSGVCAPTAAKRKWSAKWAMNAEVLQLRVFKFSRPTAAVQMLQSHRRRDHFGVFLIGSFFFCFILFLNYLY